MGNQVLEISLPEGTNKRIGVPSEQPEHAISALTKLFSENEKVTSARLGLMEVMLPDGKSEFSYTVGIECSSDQDNIHQKVLDVLRSVPAGRWPISIVPVATHYFTDEAIVFYQKQKSWLSRLFCSQRG